MESTPQPVLSYASPINAATADVPAAMDLTFERPSVAEELMIHVIALITCVFGMAVIGLMIYANLDEGTGKAIALKGIGFMIIAVIALFAARSMLRLLRFGDAPIRILLDEQYITINDPVRIGPENRVLPLARLRRCRAQRQSLALSPVTRYAVTFKMSGRRGVRVDVAAQERGVVERAAADLQRAIDRANGKT